MIRRIAITAAYALLVLGSGCASPSSHLYTLAATSAAVATSGNTSTLTVVVGPVSIPAIVDVPQIVVSKGDNQVSLDEFNRWASPLRNNIAQVVAADVSTLLGASHVSTVAIGDPDYRVSIDVQVFESVPGTAATLSALWNVRRVHDGKNEAGHTAIREASAEQGYAALAAAHSRAIGRMSTDIANAVRMLASASP